MQGIVFEVCARLGFCPAVSRALQAMDGQLVRAFNLAGMGSWGRATNGILQGRPLSVMLVNALMGLWKAAVDSLREQVAVTT